LLKHIKKGRGAWAKRWKRGKKNDPLHGLTGADTKLTEIIRRVVRLSTTKKKKIDVWLKG